MNFQCKCGYNLSEDNIVVDTSNLLKMNNNGIITLDIVVKCPNCHFDAIGFLEIPYEKNKNSLQKYAYGKFGIQISDEQLDEIMYMTDNDRESCKDEYDECNFDINENTSWEFVVYNTN